VSAIVSADGWIKASASGSNGGNCVEMMPWEKSTASSGAGQCVETAGCVCGDEVRVRDSKDPLGPVLTFTKAEFAAWLNGAKSGEFDHLA
jgi:Domain of unknown function (DUF397)